jgi:transposase InsO family protein
MAKTFEINRSSYYKWKNKNISKRVMNNKELLEKIKEIYNRNKSRYGSPRITKELRKNGIICNKKRVEKIMKENNIKAKHKKKRMNTTDSRHNLEIAPNILKRKFKVDRPNEVWCSDITYIWTLKGFLYLCTIIDLFNREIVGWSMQDNMKKEIVINALNMAVKNKAPEPGLIFHSDRGSQYASKDLFKKIKEYNMIKSMRRKENCWDNAVSESFFHTLKVEEIHDKIFVDHEKAKSCIFEYIEIYYNRKRLHSYLNYSTPVEFEQKYYESQYSKILL